MLEKVGARKIGTVEVNKAVTGTTCRGKVFLLVQAKERNGRGSVRLAHSIVLFQVFGFSCQTCDCASHERSDIGVSKEGGTSVTAELRRRLCDSLSNSKSKTNHTGSWMVRIRLA